MSKDRKFQIGENVFHINRRVTCLVLGAKGEFLLVELMKSDGVLKQGDTRWCNKNVLRKMTPLEKLL